MKTKVFLFVALVFTLASCRPVYVLVDDTDTEFSLSSERITDILPQLQNQARPSVLEGRARVQLSTPQERERVIVTFTADKYQTVLRIRNNLGIEGGRMLIDQDSVLIYDRIESSAWKVSREEGDMFFIQDISAINIMDILYPDFSEGFRTRIHESEHSYLLRSQSGKQYIIRKENYQLQKVIFPDDQFLTWTEFIFSDFQDHDMFQYPSRVQILSSDRKSNIFMLIQNIDFEPSNPDFSLGIPDHISVERL